MLERAVLGVINHLLTGEAWARARLRPFAGQHARFEMGPLALDFAVSSDGSLKPIDGRTGAQADVAIRLPDDTPLRAIADRDSIFSAARIAGSADFAEALGFVARNLRWDAEADLSRVVGDIAARRLVEGTRSVASAKTEAARRAAANFSEYLSQEAAVIARKDELRDFCTAVDALRDDLARLEKRLSRL